MKHLKARLKHRLAYYLWRLGLIYGYQTIYESYLDLDVKNGKPVQCDIQWRYQPLTQWGDYAA